MGNKIRSAEDVQFLEAALPGGRFLGFIPYDDDLRAADMAGATAAGVTWSAAQSFCSSRGGLATVDQTPHTWAESGKQPLIEWRLDGTKPAWRRADGAVSQHTVSRSQANMFTGFRCAR